MASTSEAVTTSFPFDHSQLPVRYLGLPLLTKRMTVADYLSLVEKIRRRMSSWTGIFLSYAGRLQLISFVIASMTNFWLAPFRLPGSCLKEIERLCVSFLWSGTDLNPRKSKISGMEVCKPKQEGGLGLRPLKEVNLIVGLKLIWRITSEKHSLWVKWISVYLIRKGSFWSVSEKSMKGSWIWRKILKLRGQAKEFQKIEIHNGEGTSFWHDSWSRQGRLKDMLGDRGIIDLGVEDLAYVADVKHICRKRRHRLQLLIDIESDIQLVLEGLSDDADVALWKQRNDSFKTKFSSKETWDMVRVHYPTCDWSSCVWFKHNTPKFSFLLWILMHNKLVTQEQMLSWNVHVNAQCVLCLDQLETRQYLFFSCLYTASIWDSLTRGLLLHAYTNVWEGIVENAKGNTHDRTVRYLYRYTLQAVVHIIWGERNLRTHGEQPRTNLTIMKIINKAVRNKLSSIKEEGAKDYVNGLQIWFGSRDSSTVHSLIH